MDVVEQEWYLYVVSCSDGTLYTGITCDLERRVRQHNQGHGARYTASRWPVELMAAWAFAARAAAMRAEVAMKRLRRQAKLNKISSGESFYEGKRIR